MEEFWCNFYALIVRLSFLTLVRYKSWNRRKFLDGNTALHDALRKIWISFNQWESVRFGYLLLTDIYTKVLLSSRRHNRIVSQLASRFEVFDVVTVANFDANEYHNRIGGYFYHLEGKDEKTKKFPKN